MKLKMISAVFAASILMSMTAFAGGRAVKIINNDSTRTEAAISETKAVPAEAVSGITEATGLKPDLVAVPDTARVLITLSAEKSSDSGVLNVYKKELGENNASAWRLQFSTPARLGKAGLYKEKEGDNKTPVGIFRMNTPFGRLDKLEGFPDNYIKVDKNYYWNGDSASPLYNKLVNIEAYQDFDKDKSEHIIDYGKYYNYCIDTGYNIEGTPYKGSAIYLHCVVNNENTHGCIAVPETDMISIMRLYDEGNTYIAIYDIADLAAMYK